MLSSPATRSTHLIGADGGSSYNDVEVGKRVSAGLYLQAWIEACGTRTSEREKKSGKQVLMVSLSLGQVLFVRIHHHRPGAVISKDPGSPQDQLCAGQLDCGRSLLRTCDQSALLVLVGQPLLPAHHPHPRHNYQPSCNHRHRHGRFF